MGLKLPAHPVNGFSRGPTSSVTVPQIRHGQRRVLGRRRPQGHDDVTRRAVDPRGHRTAHPGRGRRRRRETELSRSQCVDEP